ncbi:ABC transporter ATP-binding protein [Corticibacterium sp. UT-5YL-CI-8]|nr:ABC transporter ATP-binding protein [Tianweitania sp. UT-5YL-CI-8]
MDLNFSVRRGGTLGIVGESGSGKSITMLSVMGLLPRAASVTGSVRLQGREILGLPNAELARLRGKSMAMIFQDPLTAMNPVLTVGVQVTESLRLHDRSLSRRAAMDRAAELLETVSIPDPRRRLGQYPHEFSGGMRQRAMIAIAVANSPALLIADEPTTALDVTVQAQILDVLQRMRERLGLALVIITHDLGVVAGTADRVAVMYSGRLVEEGDVTTVLAAPAHPYTVGLLAAVPRIDRGNTRLLSINGSPPPLSNRPKGCAFHPRCSVAQDICRSVTPSLQAVGSSQVACHFPYGAAEASRP